MINVREITRLLEADQSHDETREQLLNALKSLISVEPDAWLWIVDVWDDHLIYEYESPDKPGRYFQRTYTVDGEIVEFGEPVEVEKRIEYVPVSTETEAVEAAMPGLAGATIIPLIEVAVAGSDVTPHIMPLLEKSIRKDGTAPIKIIQPGWGSSAYYPADVLERDGPNVFTAGTQMFWDHMTETEMAEQPEGELDNLAAVLESDARWMPNHPSGPGLYADARVFGGYREKLDELAPYIGTSIHASGLAESGEVDGREGYILTELQKTPFTTIDYVTKPGAGGAVLQLFESARPKRKPKEASTMPETELLETTEEVTVEESEAVALNEAERTELETLRKTARSNEALTIVNETLKDLTLPEEAKIRVSVEAMKELPVTDGTLDAETLKERTLAAATTEAEYLEKLTGAGQVNGMGGGAVDDGGKQQLEESVRRMHPKWTDEQVRIYVTGR